MNKLTLLGVLIVSTFALPDSRAAPPDESVCPKLIVAHWMPHIILPNFAHHNYYRDIPLIGPMQFTGDPIQQMREAKAGGIDAFAICSETNLEWCKATWNYSIAAANLVEGFFVCPAICNGPNDKEGIMLAASIEWVKAAKGQRSPLRIDGKCVIHSYDWGNATKEEVLEFRQKIREATGEEIFLVLDVDGHVTNVSEERIRDLAGVSDMIFHFWAQPLSKIEKTAKISKEAGILFGGSTAPGYWRHETEIWDPYNFTATFRNHLAWNIQNGARWFNPTTWNDFTENTHVQPTANWGDTRSSILKFYGDLLKGNPIKETRFFVSGPSEARIGLPFGVEALILQPGETASEVTVRLIDGRGQESGRWEGKSPAARDSAVTPEFTLTAYPEGRFVRPIVDFKIADGTTKQVIGAPITIWPDIDRGLVNRQVFSISDKSAANFDEVSLSFAEEERGKGLLKVNLIPRTKGLEEFEPWAEVHFMAGDVILKRIVRNENLDLKWPIEDFPIHYRFYNFPRSYRTGFVTPRLITMNGTIAYGDPLWIAPPSGEDVTLTANIPMTEVRENVIVDKSLYTNHLKISGDVKAVRLLAEPQGKSGLWVSPVAGIEMHPNVLPTGPFMMKLSLKPDAIKDLQAVIDNSDSPEYGGVVFRLSILPDGKLEFIRNNFQSVSTSSAVAGRWNDVTVSFDGKKFAFTIDGKAAGEKILDGPSKSDHVAFYKLLNIQEGRINPRTRSGIARSYSGGIADLSIISGSDPARPPAPPKPKTLVSLKFGEAGANGVTNAGSLGGTLPLPGGAGPIKETPPGSADDNSLQISGWSKTARSLIEIPQLDAGTIAFWLKPAVINDSIWMNVLDIGKGKFAVYVVGTDIIVRTPTGDQRVAAGLTSGKWVHFAFTFDSAKRFGSVLLDGNVEQTLSTSFPIDGGALAISATDDIGAASFNGLLGNVRLLNARLFPKDVPTMLMR